MPGRGWLTRLIDPPALRTFLRRLRAPDIRLALRLSLPAAVLAVVLRAVLLACMPAAFVHNDTAATLETAARLVERGAFVLDVKKTFLAPAVYGIPAILHLPVLPFLAVVQHLLGIATVFACGLLTRAWLRNWRALIVPVTLAAAFNPVLLWYEHTALAETYAVFGITLVALVATAFYRAPNRYTLAALLLALLFIAGSRPEGRLFSLFAVVLVARTLWGDWRSFRVGVASTLIWTAFLFSISRTGQSGLLLFTSLLQFTPEHLIFSPGVAESVRPLADQTRIAWQRTEPPRLVALRKQLQQTLIETQASGGLSTRAAAAQVDSIAKRAGLEIAVRNSVALPGLALRKFIVAHRELPSGDFNSYAIDGQLDALTNGGHDDHLLRASGLLWGHPLESPKAARDFLASTYRPIPGDFLTHLLRAWQSFSLLPVAPIDLPGSNAGGVPIRGLPWLYTTALCGMLCLALRDRTPLNFHQLWGAFLIGLFVLIMVTANIRARFRVLFEPFWILYAFALLDTLLIFAARLRPSRPAAAAS
ncbi:MAG: hypothetical protein PHC88_04360 [Terrimicrobiaceae bacterium]|nr:hypothetical protein [Terrimicrobiaceae bacterium]